MMSVEDWMGVTVEAGRGWVKGRGWGGWGGLGGGKVIEESLEG